MVLSPRLSSASLLQNFSPTSKVLCLSHLALEAEERKSSVAAPTSVNSAIWRIPEQGRRVNAWQLNSVTSLPGGDFRPAGGQRPRAIVHTAHNLLP